MELKTRFVKNLQDETGEGKNGTWTKGTFVTTSDGQYPVTVAFTIWGEKTSLVKNLKTGQEILVKFDLSSREYNGRYFTEAKAFAIETAASAAAPAVPVSSAPNPFDPAPVQDTLPF